MINLQLINYRDAQGREKTEQDKDCITWVPMPRSAIDDTMPSMVVSLLHRWQIVERASVMDGKELTDVQISAQMLSNEN